MTPEEEYYRIELERRVARAAIDWRLSGPPAMKPHPFGLMTTRDWDAAERLVGAGAVTNRESGVSHLFGDGRCLCGGAGVSALKLEPFATLGLADDCPRDARPPGTAD